MTQKSWHLFQSQSVKGATQTGCLSGLSQTRSTIHPLYTINSWQRHSPGGGKEMREKGKLLQVEDKRRGGNSLSSILSVLCSLPCSGFKLLAERWNTFFWKQLLYKKAEEKNRNSSQNVLFELSFGLCTVYIQMMTQSLTNSPICERLGSSRYAYSHKYRLLARCARTQSYSVMHTHTHKTLLQMSNLYSKHWQKVNSVTKNKWVGSGDFHSDT